MWAGEQASDQHPFYGLYFSSCPDILQWLNVAWDLKDNKPFPSKLLLVMDFTKVIKQY